MPRTKALLTQRPEVRVVIHHYAAAEHHRRHTDRNARISFPLSGTYREEVPGSIETLGPGDVTFKSRALVHEDWFGPGGTTVASLELCGVADDTEDALVRLAGSLWLVRRDAATLRLVVGLLDAATMGDGAGVDTIATDLLSSGTGAATHRIPPAWLTRLKHEVELAGLATPVGVRAREAGVHPVHASRLFRSCFGVTITAHAQTHAVRRALALMNESRSPLSRVAAEAGFYDQSHMNRVFHTVLGRPPGVVRQACAAARAQLAV